jgi:hypothetical protein
MHLSTLFAAYTAVLLTAVSAEINFIGRLFDKDVQKVKKSSVVVVDALGGEKKYFTIEDLQKNARDGVEKGIFPKSFIKLLAEQFNQIDADGASFSSFIIVDLLLLLLYKFINIL